MFINEFWRSLGPILLIFLLLPFMFDTGLSDRYFAIRILLLAVALIISFMWQRRNPDDSISVNVLDLIVVAFVLWHWLSCIWAINGSEALINNIRYTLGAGVYLFWRVHTNDKNFKIDHLISLVHVVCLMYVIVVWFGILKYGLEYSFSNKDLYRLQYPAGHKSLIAAFILLSLPFVMIDSKWHKLRFITMLLSIGAIMILQSRAAFLGFLALVISGLILFSFTKKLQPVRKYLVWIVLFVFLGFWGVKDKSIVQRMNLMNYVKSETAQERLATWQKTWRIIKDHPLVGVGSGNWKIHFPSTGLEPQWVLENRDVIFTRAHNDYLEILSESGAIGLLMWMSILLLSVIMALKRRHDKVGQLSFLFFAAYLTISIFDFPKERVEINLLLWSILGLNAQHFGAFRKVRKIQLPMVGILCFMLILMIPKYMGERHIVKALNARAVQDWNSLAQHASRSTSKLYSTDPYAIPVMWYKGLAEYQLGQLDDAHQSFLLAYEQHPWQYHVLNNLATTYFAKNDLENALKYYDQCQQVNPHFNDVYFNKSVVLARLNRFDEARSALSNIDSTSQRLSQFLEEIDRMEQADTSINK